MNASDLYALPASLPFGEFFSPQAAPWEWVPQIARALEQFDWPKFIAPSGNAVHIEGPVYIHPSVSLPSYTTIIGPAYIGAGTKIRPGAYIRGNVIVGENCVLGQACEFKNALLMDRVEVPHFSYVGDSILGNKAHVAAGAVLSNLRLDRKPVAVAINGERISSGLRKLGSMLGDGAEVGCNAVLQPGTILGRRALVMPSTAFGGTLPAGHIARSRTSVTTFPAPGNH